MNLSNEKFDGNYYERGIETGVSLYTHYRWIPELTIPLAFRIIEELKITTDHTILDYGCAKGYLVKALRLLYRNAYGVDISNYAISNSEVDIRPYLRLSDSSIDIDSEFGIDNFDFTIAKDVFEHIGYDEIEETLLNLRDKTDTLFAIIPLGVDGKYVIDAYENDKTHAIRENIYWWNDLFRKCGFKVKSSEYDFPGIKSNWDQHKYGNGFFIYE